MTFLLISSIITMVLVTIGVILFRQARVQIVAEDSAAVTVDKDGFIQRVLPPGRHVLKPFEKIDFTLETKPGLTTGQARRIVTGDGILIDVNWSGVYAVQPDLVTDKLNQRLRGLIHGDKAIARNVDIFLRKFMGDYVTQDLFKPAIRERIERQLNQVVAERLKTLGIVLNGLNLQAIELPGEVTEAFNKAKAIETLDGTIRQLDPTTRKIVQGVYQLDEILHWDQYLPTPSRLTMKRLGEANG